MSVVDTTERTLQVKIVYYGPGLSGKTTNLEQLSRLLNPQRRGDLMVLDTVGDRTLFFDWMPVDLGTIRGFDVKIQLYTVPGQVRYNNTRKRVLAGVDGIVFVADSQAEALDQNEFSLLNLRENLEELGLRLEDIPMVVQYNKRDLPSALPVEALAEHLGLEDYPAVESVAAKGKGVLETLRLVTRVTLQAVKDDLDPNRARRRRNDVPMDGQALLAELMRGDQEESMPVTASASEEPANGLSEESASGAQSLDADLVSEASAKQGDESPRVTVDAASVPEPASGLGVPEEAEEEHIEMEAELPEDGAIQEVVHANGPGRTEPAAGSPAADSVAVETSAQASGQETVEAISDLIRRLAAVEGLVSGLSLRVDELAEQEAGQVSEVPRMQEVLGRLEASLSELSEKVNLVERVASSLGGKVAAIERRIERVERSDREPVRAEHVRRLSELLSTVSDALAEYAAVLRPQREASAEEPVGDAPKGFVS